MKPTTLQLRNTIWNELKKHNIKPIHTYTDYKIIHKMSWKHDKYIRYVSFQFPETEMEVVKEIIKECNKVLPEGKTRMTITPTRVRAEDAPPIIKYVYIRGSGVMPENSYILI